jgi:uncharacterized RDD family membrane protein YckC
MGIGPGEALVSPEEKKENRKNNAEQMPEAPIKGIRTGFLPCQLVGFAPRLVAFMLDLVLINMLAVIFTLGGMIAYVKGGVPRQDMPLLFHNLDAYAPLFFASFILMSMTYFTYFHGAAGQTPGKMIMGLRVVREDGRPLGHRRAMLRWIGYLFSSAFLNLGFLWIIVDRKKQGWHDKMAGSLVVWS